MTPSQYIKAQGLPSLAYVARKIGKGEKTLYNWYHGNFALFEVVVEGVRSRRVSNEFVKSTADIMAKFDALRDGLIEEKTK